MQKGIEINPQKGNYWPTQPLRCPEKLRRKSTWLKSSTLTFSKSVLRLFVNSVGFVYLRRNGQGLADLGKSGYFNNGGSHKSLQP